MVAHHKHGLIPVTLNFSEQITSGIYLFGFSRNFDFVAGQVIGIALKEDEIRILFNVIEGYLSPRLSDLEAGTSSLDSHRNRNSTFLCHAQVGHFKS